MALEDAYQQTEAVKAGNEEVKKEYLLTAELKEKLAAIFLTSKEKPTS